MSIQPTSSIRMLDVHRDLLEVANLIDTAFRDQMDPEGQDYLKQIRKAAHNKHLVQWIPGSRERVSYPLFGYVWEDHNRIIGNVSLFPYLHNFKWRYLIANVAVDPDYQGRGIGKELTRVGIKHAYEHGSQGVWLQVREENSIALKMYQELGFVERARRTTWLYIKDGKTTGSDGNNPNIRPRKDRDWPMQSLWLDDIYPNEVNWYLQLSKNRLRPGLWQKISSLFSPLEIKHFSAERDGTLLGVATLENRSRTHTTLWLAPNQNHEGIALEMLLNHITNRIYNERKIYLNYPAGQTEQFITGSGFSKQNTLIWMEKGFY